MPGLNIIANSRNGHNGGMASTDSAPESFQFRLRSLFLVILAVAVALGLYNWLDRESFSALAILAVEFAAMVAILLKGKGRWALAALICVILLVPVTFLFLLYLFEL
jgi:hypothetical protein